MIDFFFISHMVQIIPFKNSSPFSTFNLFISHMVQIIQMAVS